MSLAVTTKSAREVVETNFRGVMRWVYSVTPPMGGKNASVKMGVKVKADGTASNTYNVDFNRGFINGQIAISCDLGRAFREIPDEKKQWLQTAKGRHALVAIYGPTATPELLKQSPQEFYKWYTDRQNKNKRFRGRQWRRAFSSTVGAIAKMIYKRQGVTPAGWIKATDGIRAGNPPAWIRRHAATISGSFTEKSSPTELIFEAINPSNHPDSPKIQGEMNTAYQMQANTMARALAAYLKNK
jgi:hypothetical protein